MSYAVVQHTSGSGSGTSLTTSKSLPGAPTAGNWIIAAVCLQINSDLTTCPIDTASWFYVDETLHSHPSGAQNTNNILRIIARKVVAGDTAAMPAFCSSGSSFNAWMAVEISGGSGTWATDFHSARNNVNIDGVAAITSPKDTTLVANTFALAFATAYNETSNGSWSSGWTVDENTHNSSNYGSWGCVHQVFSTAGTAFQATFTRAGSSGNPKGIVTVLLTPSQPATPHIKRIRNWGGGSAGTPGSITVGGDPINGSMLAAHLFWADGSAAGPTVGGSWTNYASALNGSNPVALGLYRYASSDTRALAALCSAGSQFWSANIYEIGGVTGTFATDHASTQAAYVAATTSAVTTTSDSTTHTSQLAVTSFGNYASTTVLAAPTGADLIHSDADNSEWGAWSSAEVYETSSSVTVQSTWTPTAATAKPCGYIQDIWGSGTSSTETGTALMAMSGISFAGVGSDHQKETGTGRMALSGVSFVGSGGRKETGTAQMALAGVSFLGHGGKGPGGSGAMHLAGVSIVAAGFDLGAPGGVRQFWTF